MSENCIVQTSRIILRALKEIDAEALHYYRNIPQLSIFQGWSPDNPEEVVSYSLEMGAKPAFNSGDWYQIVRERQPQAFNFFREYKLADRD